MQLKVTAKYEPDPHEEDSEDETGLTQDAYDDITQLLMDIGFEDIEFSQVSS